MRWQRVFVLLLALSMTVTTFASAAPSTPTARPTMAGPSMRASLKERIRNFHPVLNFDDLAKIAWRNGEAKLAIRNDWIENFLNIALNDAIQNQSDIKSGEGSVHVVGPTVGDSIITVAFTFNVVPKNVWFDPHVRCEGQLRLSFPQTALATAQVELLDREPIQHCDVNGTVGRGLDLGSFVRARLNHEIGNLPDQNFLFKIGQALFGSDDIKDRMTRMFLLQELVPVATIGMDDCAADAELDLPSGNSVCLKLQWPAGRFDAAMDRLVAGLPAATPSTAVIPEERIQEWRNLSPVCASPKGTTPSKSDCDTGDMNLFAGLLCLSGEQAGCEMVRDSQDEQGRWWRSPQHVGLANDDFSGDMFMGSVAYLNQTHDATRLRTWEHFILSQRQNFPPRGGTQLSLFQTCPGGANGVCNLMGPEWYWLKQMSKWAGAPAETHPDYGYDSSWMLVESLANERGFRLHLVAVAVLMRKMFGEGRDANVDLAAKVLAAREPQNPFFVFLAYGRDERVLQLMNAQCPTANARPAVQNQWSWERQIEDKAYLQSMGWDCVFLAKLWNRGVSPAANLR